MSVAVAHDATMRGVEAANLRRACATAAMSSSGVSPVPVSGCPEGCGGPGGVVGVDVRVGGTAPGGGVRRRPCRAWRVGMVAHAITRPIAAALNAATMPDSRPGRSMQSRQSGLRSRAASPVPGSRTTVTTAE